MAGRWISATVALAVVIGATPATAQAAEQAISSGCADPGTPIEAYRADVPGARPMWGKVCPPDYNLLQPKVLGPIFNITEDPATHNVVITSWPHATTIVVDPEGGGTAMTFRTSAVTSLMAQEVTDRQVTGPCAENPAQSCTAGPALQAMQGPVDAAGRLWVVSAQSTPTTLKADDPATRLAHLHPHLKPRDQGVPQVAMTTSGTP